MSWLLALDYIGVAVFAATGALAASRKQLDVIGFIFLAAVTGIGGGTFRDLVLGVPVFWIENTTYLTITSLAALVTYLTAHLVESRHRVLLWLDAMGLAVFGVLGAAKGYEVTGSAPIAIVMGMLSASFGGVLRDILAGENSVLLRPEIYVSAALAGAVLFTIMVMMGAPNELAAISGALTAFLIRGGALIYNWTLPRYRPRPGKRL